jgi:hypothetical protein
MFAALTPDLPQHADEVMAAHEGQPSVEVQARTHGAGLPAADLGADDRSKYAC